MRTALITLLAASISQSFAQDIVSTGPDIVYDAIHNVSDIAGSWSSGSKAVQTGPGFCNPVDSTFTYPAVAGMGYSFTDDGYFEEALYRFTGNGTDPRCIIGVMQFQHGRHQLLANGSIVLEPYAEDGRQQIQNPCVAQSNVLRQFNQTTLFLSWRIFRDPQGNDKLHLFRFDGAPFPPMFRVSTTPTMLPTVPLTNTSIGAQATKRSLLEPEKRSAAEATGPVVAAAFAGVGLLSLGLLQLI